VVKRRQRSQQEFFVSQGELPDIAPKEGAKGRTIALDWFEQTLRVAVGLTRATVSVQVRSSGLADEDLERLKTYQVFATRESNLGQKFGRVGVEAESLPRLLAVYHSFATRPQDEPCLVVSVGRTGGKCGLVAGGELAGERPLPQELSLRGIWSRYLEGNAPLRKHIEMLCVTRPEAEAEVFEGFARALKTGEPYDEGRIRLRPPIDLNSSLPGLLSFCQVADPGGEAKAVILADWAATHSNLADLLGREYRPVLSPPPEAAFDQAVVGLVAYGLQKKREEEKKNSQRLADLGAQLERLSSEFGLLWVAGLTKELITDLENISPAIGRADGALNQYLQLDASATALGAALRRAASSPEGGAGKSLKELGAEWDRLSKALEELEARHRASYFIRLIEEARRHRSLQQKADLLKSLLGLEEVLVAVGSVLSTDDLNDIEVCETKGDGNAIVVESLVERGYRDAESKKLIQRPKVRVRLETPVPAVKRGTEQRPKTARKNPAEPRPRTEATLQPGTAQTSAGSGSGTPPAERRQVVAPTPAPGPGAASPRKVVLATLAAGMLLLTTLGLVWYVSLLSSRAPGATIGPDSQQSVPGKQSSTNGSGDTTPVNSGQENTEAPSATANVNSNANAELAPGSGAINVSSNLGDVRVWVGNNQVYLSRRFTTQALDLAPGQYVLRATRAGYPDWSAVVSVRLGERTPVFIAFKLAQDGDEDPGALAETQQPQTPTTNGVALQYLDLANRLYQHRDYQGTLAQANEGLKYDPSNVALLRLKASAEDALRVQAAPASTPARETTETQTFPAPAEVRAPAAPAPSTYQPPVVVKRYIPSYPESARAYGAAGSVEVRVNIDEQGRVVSAKAVGGHPLLRLVAEAAARQWRYTPAQRGGQPVRAEATIVFNFERPR